ncbi:diacylglycerol kinase [Faunimonas pinastri]
MRSSEPSPPFRKKTGVAHLFASAGYSFDGLRRMLKEAAFRQELLFAIALFAVLAVRRAETEAYFVQAVFLILLLAVEALNTAIEVLTDAVSPGYSAFAKQSKDLGSFAVFCLLSVNALVTLFFAFLR